MREESAFKAFEHGRTQPYLKGGNIDIYLILFCDLLPRRSSALTWSHGIIIILVHVVAPPPLGFNINATIGAVVSGPTLFRRREGCCV